MGLVEKLFGYLCVSFIMLSLLCYTQIYLIEMKAFRKKQAKNGESEDYFSCRRIAYIAVDIVFIHHHVPGDFGRRFRSEERRVGKECRL